MRASEVGGETLRLLSARRIQTLVVMGLAASMVLAVLMTVGRAVVLEQAVQARTGTPEGRTIVVTDTSASGLIRPEIVRALARVGGIERVVASTTPVDAVNLHLGVGSDAIPVWGVNGNIRDVATLRSGRWPEPGEALVSEEALQAVGMAGPAGALLRRDGQEIPIVGTYDARSPFMEIEAGAVQRLGEDEDGLRRLHIVAVDVRDIDPITVVAISLFDRSSAGELRVERSTALIELQELLAGDISSFRRELVGGVLLAGMFLVGMVLLAEVLSRRRDLGRQRALGARRSTVILLLVARTGFAAALGSTIGLVSGLSYVALTTGELPAPSFVTGLFALSILAPVLGSIVPALWAAQRDPVLELRTA